MVNAMLTPVHQSRYRMCVALVSATQNLYQPEPRQRACRGFGVLGQLC